MSTETFMSWRDQIQAELVTARSELEVASGDVAAAQAARDAAIAKRNELNAALGNLQRPVPAALRSRMQPIDREIHVAEGRLTQAKQIAETGRQRIDDLVEALAACAALISPAEPDEAEAAA